MKTWLFPLLRSNRSAEFRWYDVSMILERFPELLALPEIEKLQLAEELYGTALRVLPHLTEDEIHAELEGSMEEYHRDTATATGWEQVKARVLARRRV